MAKPNGSGSKLRVVDTGGIIPDDQQLIPAEIFRQARVALEEADVIVMVVDGRTELASPDIDLARLLLRTGKPLLLAVNKADTPQLEPYAEEFRRLGIKEAVPDLGRKRQRHSRVVGACARRDARARRTEAKPERRPREPQIPRLRSVAASDRTSLGITEEKEAEIRARDEGGYHRPPERRQVNPAECADRNLARNRFAGCRYHPRRGG